MSGRRSEAPAPEVDRLQQQIAGARRRHEELRGKLAELEARLESLGRERRDGVRALKREIRLLEHRLRVAKGGEEA